MAQSLPEGRTEFYGCLLPDCTDMSTGYDRFTCADLDGMTRGELARELEILDRAYTGARKDGRELARVVPSPDGNPVAFAYWAAPRARRARDLLAATGRRRG